MRILKGEINTEELPKVILLLVLNSPFAVCSMFEMPCRMLI
jgi:hypothetical protein